MEYKKNTETEPWNVKTLNLSLYGEIGTGIASDEWLSFEIAPNYFNIFEGSSDCEKGVKNNKVWNEMPLETAFMLRDFLNYALKEYEVYRGRHS